MQYFHRYAYDFHPTIESHCFSVQHTFGDVRKNVFFLVKSRLGKAGQDEVIWTGISRHLVERAL